jgi:ketosteroid isomerase-like protein
MDRHFRDRIHEMYPAYLEGHFQFLLDEVVHDEIEFVSNAPTDAFPYFARGKGKVALLAAWKASRVEYEFLSYTPLLVAADGADTAAVVVKMRVKAIATNRVIDLMVADFLKFRDSRVIEFRQFMDGIEATEQWMGREIDISKS